jgi:hypothetical protein
MSRRSVSSQAPISLRMTKAGGPLHLKSPASNAQCVNTIAPPSTSDARDLPVQLPARPSNSLWLRQQQQQQQQASPRPRTRCASSCLPGLQFHCGGSLISIVHRKQPPSPQPSPQFSPPPTTRCRRPLPVLPFHPSRRPRRVCPVASPRCCFHANSVAVPSTTPPPASPHPPVDRTTALRDLLPSAQPRVAAASCER